MDRNTLSQYGWVVIVIIIIAILIGTATPFGSILKASVQNIGTGLINVGNNLLDEALQDGNINGDGSESSDSGERETVSAPELGIHGVILVISNAEQDAESYLIYRNDELIAEISSSGAETKYGLSALPKESSQISVIGKADGKKDSEKSTIQFENTGNLIPVGGVYYKNVSLYNATGNYNGATEKLIGDGSTVYFPSIMNKGDVYTYGEYEYRYKANADVSSWLEAGLISNGWGVDVIDNTQSTYGQFLAEINGAPITSLMSTYANCSSLTSLQDGFTIPETVVTVSQMFYHCELLVSIPDSCLLPEGVVGVSHLFDGCKKLERLPDEFAIPKYVKETSYMFNYCTSLQSVPDGVVIPDGVEIISCMFKDCIKLNRLPNNFVIPQGVKKMDKMFYYCTKLSSLPDGFEIPSSVENIEAAFVNCSSLTGTIVVNANPNYYDRCFNMIYQPIHLIGAASAETKAALASCSSSYITYE